MNKVIYMIIAMLVIGSIVVSSIKYIENSRESRALEIWKVYVMQARGAAAVGSPIPEPPSNLPSGYFIAVTGDYIELRNSTGVVARDWYR